MASCGSRTGLFGGDAFGGPDGSFPETTPFPDGPTDGPIKCIPGRFTFELATAQLMFVIDRSGSMAFSLDGQRPDGMGNLPPGIMSRWDTLRDGLFQTDPLGLLGTRCDACGEHAFPRTSTCPYCGPFRASSGIRTITGSA
jgi:hypothetical protein